MPASRRPDGGPGLLWIPAAVAIGFLVLPLVALLARVPWGSVGEVVATPLVAEALRLSLVTASIATALCILFGVPLAWVLASADRWNVVPRRLLRALVTVPLVLPPVVGGIALLSLLGRTGLVGGWLYDGFGITVPFTTTAVVLAQTFVALPFLVLAVEGALQGVDARLELAAAGLGASRLTVFRRVTLPLVLPGVTAGAVLCFARALGEFGATITFAGSFPGVTQTIPISAYLALQSEPEAAIVLSLLLLAISVIVLVALRERWIRGVLR
jgi:molybdate transport system permease protein